MVGLLIGRTVISEMDGEKVGLRFRFEGGMGFRRV